MAGPLVSCAPKQAIYNGAGAGSECSYDIAEVFATPAPAIPVGGLTQDAATFIGTAAERLSVESGLSASVLPSDVRNEVVVTFSGDAGISPRCAS